MLLRRFGRLLTVAAGFSANFLYVVPVSFNKYSNSEISVLGLYSIIFFLPLVIPSFGSYIGITQLNKTNKNINFNIANIFFLDLCFKIILLVVTIPVCYILMEDSIPYSLLTVMFLINLFTVFDAAFSNYCVITDMTAKHLCWSSLKTVSLVVAYSIQWLIGFDISIYFYSQLFSTVLGFFVIYWMLYDVLNANSLRNFTGMKSAAIANSAFLPSVIGSIAYGFVERYFALKLGNNIYLYQFFKTIKDMVSTASSAMERIFLTDVDKYVASKKQFGISFVHELMLIGSLLIVITFANYFLRACIDGYFGNEYTDFVVYAEPCMPLLMLYVFNFVLTRFFLYQFTVSKIFRIDLITFVISIAIMFTIYYFYGPLYMLYAALIPPTINVVIKLIECRKYITGLFLTSVTFFYGSLIILGS